MDLLADFFAVRPVFTINGLRALWGVYVITQLLPFLYLLTNVNWSTAAIGPLLALLFQRCLDIVVFRLLIEVAAKILSDRTARPS
jgi:hypothetical protein